MKLATILLTAFLAGCAIPKATITPNNTTSRLKCDDKVGIKIRNTVFNVCKSNINKDLKKKLDFVAQVKQYEKEVLNFPKTSNYREYFNNTAEKAEPRYLLYITPALVLPYETKSWNKITIEDSYCAETNKAVVLWSTCSDTLEDELEYYNSKGYDTYYRSYTDSLDYSLITPEFLGKSKARQAIDVLHEDFHKVSKLKHGKQRDSSIDEAMATVFSYAAAMDFFDKEGKYEDYLKVEEDFENWLGIASGIMEYYYLLREIYKSNKTVEEKIKGKEAVLEEARAEGLELNNARIWGTLPYVKHTLTVLKVTKNYPDVQKLAEILVNAPVSEKEALKYLKEF